MTLPVEVLGMSIRVDRAVEAKFTAARISVAPVTAFLISEMKNETSERGITSYISNLSIGISPYGLLDDRESQE